jgi:5'-deoxynucleotidase YfbR-like HD superfamily hydrolase
MSARQPITSELYMSGKVRRWHTHHRYHQTVADHSWGVAAILLGLEPNISREALLVALFHDSHEIATGDAPSYSKDQRYRRWEETEGAEWENRNLPRAALDAMMTLSDREQKLIRLADALEALHFIHLQDDRSETMARAHQYLNAKVERISADLSLDKQRELPL